MNLKLLKAVTIFAPAIFVWVIEVVRHKVFVESDPMTIGNIVVSVVVLIGSIIFTRVVFGIIERMQRESLRRNKELAALNSVALAVSESLNLDIVLYRALEKVLEVTSAEAGEMFLWDERSQEMVRRMHAGLFPEAFQEKTRFRSGEDCAGLVAQSGEPIVVQDITQDPRLLRTRIRESGFRSLACVPLKSKNVVIGSINIATLSQRQFTSEDVQLLTSIGNQISVAVENALLHEKVQDMAALEERERIAREMHDSLAQVLSYVNTKTQAARQFLATGQSDQAETQLKQLEEIARDTYADVREVILGLRSTTTPQKGMEYTLKEYLFRFNQLSNIKTELQINNGTSISLPTATELQVIRIIQEALTNARKHAQCSHAWVSISNEDHQVRIEIKDDGQGFDVSHIKRGNWPQFGLQVMKERAESVRGTLDIISAVGQGTCVILKVPQVQGEREYENIISG